MGYLIRRQDVSMTEAMPFQQHFEVRIPLSIEKVGDLGAALQDCSSILKSGDLLNVCSFSDANYSRLTEVVSIRVVSCDRNRIEVIQVSELIKVPEQKKVVDVSSNTNLRIVKVNNGRAYEVRDDGNNTVELFVDEAQAKQFIDNYTARLPKAKEVEKEDRANWTLARSKQSGKFLVKNGNGEVLKEFSDEKSAQRFLDGVEEVKAA